MSKECCDDGKGSSPSTPSRSGGGSSSPDKNDGKTGPSIIMLAGSRGTEPGGTPKAATLEVDSSGALKVKMLTNGETKTYQIDNLLLVIRDGLVTFSELNGSGIVTEV